MWQVGTIPTKPQRPYKEDDEQTVGEKRKRIQMLGEVMNDDDEESD